MNEHDLLIFLKSKMNSMYEPPYKSHDVDSALAEYVLSLRKYRRDELEAAWAWIKETHDKPRWPLVPVWINAIVQQRKKRAAKRPPESAGERERRFKQEANELIRSYPGRKAWFDRRIVDQVFRFYVQSGMTPNFDADHPDEIYLPRLPTDDETARMAAKQRAQEKNVPKLKNGTALQQRIYHTLTKAAEIERQKRERAWRGGDYWRPRDPLRQLFRRELADAAAVP